MTIRGGLAARGAATVALAAAGTAVAWACGPFFVDLVTVTRGAPADAGRYARGELGIVKPTFARRYLVQAYRVTGGVAPLAPDAGPRDATAPQSPLRRWQELQARELPAAAAQGLRPITAFRTGADYSSFDNCLDAAFEAALGAHAERVARYGARSGEVSGWVTAQAAVFQNCGNGALVLPAAAPPEADSRIRADRDYQMAAAYFYATQYDEAAGRFRAIAANGASPWRASGRYLAARSLIRSVTVPGQVKDVSARLLAAERDLRATLADREAAALHESARGLLDFVAARARPIERLHELSARLAVSPAVSPQDLIDYTRLMDAALGETAAGGPGLDLAQVTAGDDLTDWIIAVQRGGDRARQRWREIGTERWLIAALWTTPAAHADAPALVMAAAGVPRTSPAFLTASFLRVRLLIQRGDVEGARAALSALPLTTGPGVDAEALNLLRAARFTAAATLDELLAAAPRAIAPDVASAADLGASIDRPIWDDEVAAVFNGRLPLRHLVAAAESSHLPARLRLRVAQAAFTRAALLERSGEGVQAARVLGALAPRLQTDLARYTAAGSDAARDRAVILALLRTPGLSINVRGLDDDDSYGRTEPARTFTHAGRGNWWCRIEDQIEERATSLGVSEGRPAFPYFLGEAERRQTAAELEALRAIGDARAHATRGAIEWARSHPSDPLAAEALALAIDGWRWSACNDGPKSDLPRRAFALLHRQFPQSEWAMRTKYWYD